MALIALEQKKIRRKRPLIFFLVLGSTLLATGCGDDQMLVKGLMVAGGAAGGAFLGSQLARRGDKQMGAILGGAAGGVLGLLVGGAIGGNGGFGGGPRRTY